MTKLPTFDDVLDAARVIEGQAVRTPLIESPALNERLGGRVLMKAENLQVIGAFKFRGAYNRIARLCGAAVPVCGGIGVFRRAAEAGDPVGQLNYGLDLMRGRGVRADEALGRAYVDEAARAGISDARRLQASGYDLDEVTPDADNWKYAPLF